MRGTQSKNNFAVFTPRREGFFCILVYTAQNRKKGIYLIQINAPGEKVYSTKWIVE